MEKKQSFEEDSIRLSSVRKIIIPLQIVFFVIVYVFLYFVCKFILIKAFSITSASIAAGCALLWMIFAIAVKKLRLSKTKKRQTG